MEADMIFKSKNYDYENNIDRNWQNGCIARNVVAKKWGIYKNGI